MSQPGSQCVLEGNSDLYGIGVRIGLYSQWVATLLITLFSPREEGTNRVINLIVQSAIFLGLCTDSTSGGSAVASVITQLLLCGSLSSLTGDGISHAGKFSGIFRVLFYTALSAYGCWFWWSGIDQMDMPGCPEQIAFFGPSFINGWVRTFGKVVSIIGLLVSVAMICWNIYAVNLRLKGEWHLNRKPGQRPQVEIGLLLLSIGLMAFSIATIEYLIDKNNITGLSDIDSVGQFLPLLVGTISCFQTVLSLFTRGHWRKRRCWFLFGKHL